MNTNIVIHWDCLEVMKSIPNGSIDAIITDPPYWTTACKWDSVIPFEPMWEQLKRIIKPNWAIVLFGSEPFSSALRMSNIKNYKYDWIWDKWCWSNFATVKYQPFKEHEIISVFWEWKIHYYPQRISRSEYSLKCHPIWKERIIPATTTTDTNNIVKINWKLQSDWLRNPKSILDIKLQKWRIRNVFLHPTQKPVALIEYLIRTYTNEWETVLDFTAWSGTTWVACQNTNRNYILIEKDEWYYEISKERLLKNKILLW